MIGEKLRELLALRGMRQTELAEMIGVPKTTINSIIMRNNKSVDFSTMEKIADALDVPIEYFGSKDRPEKKEQPIIAEGLSEKELDFVQSFTALTPAHRRILLGVAQVLLQEQEEHPDSLV